MRCGNARTGIARSARGGWSQHLGCASEPDDLALLLDGQGCQKDWHDPVLPEQNPVVGMPGELKDEATIPSFVEELIRRQAPDR